LTIEELLLAAVNNIVDCWQQYVWLAVRTTL